MVREYHIGKVIQDLRKREGMTQAELAEAIGRSGGFIGKLERDEGVDPSYSTLLKLSKEVEEDVTDILKQVRDSDGTRPFRREVYRITRKGEGVRVFRPSNLIEGVEYISFNEGFPYSRIQVSKATFKKKCNIEPHYHWGDEFLHVVKGDLRFNRILSHKEDRGEGEVWKGLNTMGESEEDDYVWLRAWIPHKYEVKGEENVETLVVSYDPRGARGMYERNEEFEPEMVEGWDIEDKDLTASQNGIGPKITEARQQVGFTKKEMVEALSSLYDDPDRGDILSPSHLSRIERNEATPSYKVLRGLHDLLERPISSFFSLSKTISHMDGVENYIGNEEDPLEKDLHVGSNDPIPATWKTVTMDKWRQASTSSLINMSRFSEDEEPRVHPYLIKFGDHQRESEMKEVKKTLMLYPAEGQDVVYVKRGEAKVHIVLDRDKRVRSGISPYVIHKDSYKENVENTDVDTGVVEESTVKKSLQDNDMTERFVKETIEEESVLQIDCARAFYALRSLAPGTEVLFFRWRPSWDDI